MRIPCSQADDRPFEPETALKKTYLMDDVHPRLHFAISKHALQQISVAIAGAGCLDATSPGRGAHGWHSSAGFLRSAKHFSLKLGLSPSWPKRSTARADLSERSGTRGLVWLDVVEDRPEPPYHHCPIPRGSVCERRQCKPSALRGFQGELSARAPRSTGSPARQGAQRPERQRLLGNLTIALA